MLQILCNVISYWQRKHVMKSARNSMPINLSRTESFWENMKIIFNYFSLLRLKSFLVEETEPFILHSEYPSPWTPGASASAAAAMTSLLWRHNEHDSVSNHQPRGSLLNRLFRRLSKKTSKLRVTGLCVGNSPGPVNSPHKGPVTRKMFPFDDVIM